MPRSQDSEFVTAEVEVTDGERRAGLNGNRARQISDSNGVSVTLPAQGDAGSVKLVGPAAAVEAARSAVEGALSSAVRRPSYPA